MSELNDLIRRELLAVAEMPVEGGRTAMAKTTALRTLSEIERRQGDGELSEAERRLWAPDRYRRRTQQWP